MSAKLSFSQHYGRRSSINSDSISISFETLDITTPKITNHRGREAKCCCRVEGEHISIVWGMLLWGSR